MEAAPGRRVTQDGIGGPAIDDVSVTSRPADGTDTFKAGERIEVTFTFDEAVEVQNAGSNGANVSIRISMGATNNYVTWSTNFLRMDHPRKLVFGLTVNSSHEDDDGLCISASCGADTIRLSGGGAIVAAEDGVAASRHPDALVRDVGDRGLPYCGRYGAQRTRGDFGDPSHARTPAPYIPNHFCCQHETTGIPGFVTHAHTCAVTRGA